MNTYNLDTFYSMIFSSYKISALGIVIDVSNRDFEFVICYNNIFYKVYQNKNIVTLEQCDSSIRAEMMILSPVHFVNTFKKYNIQENAQCFFNFINNDDETMYFFVSDTNGKNLIIRSNSTFFHVAKNSLDINMVDTFDDVKMNDTTMLKLLVNGRANAITRSVALEFLYLDKVIKKI